LVVEICTPEIAPQFASNIGRGCGWNRQENREIFVVEKIHKRQYSSSHGTYICFEEAQAIG
jgi:hypothetical protein